MRVCFFTPNFLPAIGGAELATDSMARGLIARGHQVTILCQRKRKPPDVPYPVRRYRRPPAQHLWPEVLTWAVRRAYNAWRFDVMLAVYGYPAGYAANLVAKKRGFKVVLNCQGGDVYPNFHALKKPRVLNTIRSAYRHADRVIPVSQWIASRIREICESQPGPLPGPMPPMDIVYNGIDLARHDQLRDESRNQYTRLAGSPPLEKNKFVLHLARVHPVKRHELAVRAVHRLRDLFKSRGLRYAIVGDGQAMPDVRRLIAELDLGDIVLTLGSRVGLEKAWLFDNALFAITASREEGLPHAVIEFMASGLPTLVSDIGPHRELVENKNWGLLFRSGDLDDLEAKLRQMIQSDLSPWRHNALAIRDNYSLNKMIDGVEKSCLAALEMTP